MNITNAEYFTFNVDNSMFLTGVTGCGKSVLQDAVIERYIKAFKPEELQFVLLDMTGLDFESLQNDHKEYIETLVDYDSDAGLKVLEEMAETSLQRIKITGKKPMLFICIEECDMARKDQKRFDDAVSTINKNAKAANMKLIYSTSAPFDQTISERLMKSFDLIVSGQLASEADANYLGIEQGSKIPYHQFAVVSPSVVS